MNTIIWLVSGAVLGWLATIIIHRRQSAQWLNIIVGMAGAFLSGFLFPRMFRVSTIQADIFSLPGLIISLGGAVILLVVVNFITREPNVTNAFIERNWAQVRGKIHTRWDKLTEQDIAAIDGNHSRFIGALQNRYGYTYVVAEDQLQRYLKSARVGSRRTFR